MKRRILTASTSLIALGLALSAAPAVAQQTEEAMHLGRIVIGYEDDGTPIYAGENTTYLEEEDLRATGGAVNIDHILRQQTSVYTQQDTKNPAVAVNIRGFEGSGRVAVSVDGVPQNYRITGHAAQSSAFVEENFLKGIDITRGAVTTSGGTGIAGSVNFRTIEAEDVVKDGQTVGALTRLSFGSNGESSSAMQAVAHRTEDYDVLLAYSRRMSSDYEDGDGATVANTDRNVQSLLFKTGYNFADGQRVTFQASRYGAEYYATSYEKELVSDQMALGYSISRGAGLNLQVNAFYNKTSEENLAGTGSYVGRILTTETVGLNATNVSEFTLGNWDVTSVNGFEFSRDELGGSTGGVNPTTGTATRASLFSENVMVNGNWELTLGLRANKYELEGAASQGNIDISNTSIDPKLTLAYQVNDWLQPYVTVSRTMRSPTLQETMLGGSHPGGGNFMIANPALEPEISQGVELGFNIEKTGLFTANDRLSGRVNYYRMDVENYVVAGFGFTNAWGQTGAAFTNVAGTSKTEGFEVQLDYEIENYVIGLSYTKNNSSMPSNTPGLGAGQYLPDQTASLRIAGKFMQDKLTLGAQYNYTSGGLYTSLYTSTAVQRDEDYGLLDIFAVYEVNDNFKLNAKVTNVANKTYVPWLSNSENGMGRSVYLGAEMRF